MCGVVTQAPPCRQALLAALAQKYDYVYFAAGIHPEFADTTPISASDRIADILVSDKKAVAVGEIGLDYHCDVDRDKQKRLFETQLELAVSIGKPVVVHDRDAHADTLELLQKFRPRGMVHCFSGSVEMAHTLLNIGLYLGFTGAVTFKNNKKAPAVVEMAPLDRILVETDCPYMAPVPLRGRRSDSSMIEYVIERIAQIKGISPDTAGKATAANARRVFGIS